MKNHRSWHPLRESNSQLILRSVGLWVFYSVRICPIILDISMVVGVSPVNMCYQILANFKWFYYS